MQCQKWNPKSGRNRTSERGNVVKFLQWKLGGVIVLEANISQKDKEQEQVELFSLSPLRNHTLIFNNNQYI